MNDEQPKFRFTHNGVTYTVTFANLDWVVKDLDEASTEKYLENKQNFKEARDVISRIKAKL